MLSHEEIQEMHLYIGAAIEEAGDWRAGLDRALELAAILVSDTDPDNCHCDTPVTSTEPGHQHRGDEDGCTVEDCYCEA